MCEVAKFVNEHSIYKYSTKLLYFHSVFFIHFNYRVAVQNFDNVFFRNQRVKILRRHSTVHKRLLSVLYWLHMLRTDVYTPQALITFNGYCKLVCGSYIDINQQLLRFVTIARPLTISYK